DSYHSQVFAQQQKEQEEEKKAREAALNLLVEEKIKKEKQIKADEKLAQGLSKQMHGELNQKQKTQLPKQNKQSSPNIAIGAAATPTKTNTTPVPVQNNVPAARYDNSSGGARDISATYNNSGYALQSFFKTISTQFSRTANNSE